MSGGYLMVRGVYVCPTRVSCVGAWLVNEHTSVRGGVWYRPAE